MMIHVRRGRDGIVNSPRLAGEVQVERAQNDSSMVFRAAVMKAEEAAPEFPDNLCRDVFVRLEARH